MKKVLIITNLFHASPRIPGMCKYLPTYGWTPVVLATPIGENPEARLGPPNNFTKTVKTIEVPYINIIEKLKRLAGFRSTQGSRAQLEKRFGGIQKSGIRIFVRKLILLAGALIAYPDEMRWWKKPAIKSGLALLRKEHFDVLFTSSSPVTSHIIGNALKNKTGMPWIADFRDLWTQNHNYLYPKLRKYFEKKLELRTIRIADILTTVSKSLADKLASRYPDIHVASIPNGFDPENVNEPSIAVTKKFTITYTGTIYINKQNPLTFLHALKAFIEKTKIPQSNIEVRFFGTPQKWLDEQTAQVGLQSVVRQYGHMPRTDVFARQRESQLLLLFGWEDIQETGIFPLKLFEYMAARRPILATGGTNSEAFKAVLDETAAGEHATHVSDITKLLVQYYGEYIRTGAVAYHGNSQKMDTYSCKAMAQSFAQELDSVIKHHT